MSGAGYHRTRRQDQRLVGFECQDCGWVSFPEEKRVCKRCSAAPADLEPVQLAERGTVRTFVVQERLPDEFDTPQPLAIVDVPQADADGNPTNGSDVADDVDRSEEDDRTEESDRTEKDDRTEGSEPARVYGLLTETSLEELEVGATVEARFRELFTVGERPVHSFKFSTPRTGKTRDSSGETSGGDGDD